MAAILVTRDSGVGQPSTVRRASSSSSKIGSKSCLASRISSSTKSAVSPAATNVRNRIHWIVPYTSFSRDNTSVQSKFGETWDAIHKATPNPGFKMNLETVTDAGDCDSQT
jgi:hypothetical protein